LYGITPKKIKPIDAGLSMPVLQHGRATRTMRTKYGPNMNLLKTLAAVSSMTLLSRILGFVMRSSPAYSARAC